MKTPLLSLPLLLTLQALASAGSTLVVNPGGHFAFQTTALNGVECAAGGEHAFVTMGAALVAAREGDTIIVCPGRYPEALRITTSHLTIVGHPEAALDGGNTRAVGITIAAGVTGLLLQGVGARHFTEAGLLAVEGPTSRVTVEFSTFTENGNGVVVGNAPGQEGAFTHVFFRVLNSKLTNNTGVSIAFTNCRSCRIQRNTIRGSQVGILQRAHNNGPLEVKASRILLNTVTQAGQVGIRLEANAEGAGRSATLRNTTLQNNTITDVAAGAAIELYAAGAATVTQNRLLRSTIQCLAGNPGIHMVADNGGSVEKITQQNNVIDPECAP